LDAGSLKDGKIVVLLQGRYAGKKAVILKTMDDNAKERPYGHCVVVGACHTVSNFL
jgi:large subunit ribosomal protein L27e